MSFTICTSMMSKVRKCHSFFSETNTMCTVITLVVLLSYFILFCTKRLIIIIINNKKKKKKKEEGPAPRAPPLNSDKANIQRSSQSINQILVIPAPFFPLFAPF